MIKSKIKEETNENWNRRKAVCIEQYKFICKQAVEGVFNGSL